MAVPSVRCAGGCGYGARSRWTLSAGHRPWPSIRLSVRPSLKVQLCLFLSFLVSKWQQMNYKSDQILLQGEGVCV